MKRYNFFLEQDQVDFLDKLPGTVSEQIRRAINEFIERQKNKNISASKSKGSD